MAEIALTSPVTSASPPVLAHDLALLPGLFLFTIGSIALLLVLFDALAHINYFSTLLTHTPLMAILTGLQVFCKDCTTDKLLFTIGFVSNLWDNVTLHLYMFVSLLCRIKLFTVHRTFGFSMLVSYVSL